MTEEINFETYLIISQNKFEIYLFDKKNLKNLYKKEVILKNKDNILNLNLLTKFLEDNVFKIEKLIEKFVNNIFVVIDNYKTSNLSFGIKRKSYDDIINKKFLENILLDAKDLFNANYQDHRIMHIIINRYIYNDNVFLSFQENKEGDHFCIEVEFKYISKEFISEIDKILGKFQIKTIKYFDGNYIKDFFKYDKIEISQTFNKIQEGFNENEVELVPKSIKKRGFFEKFFQLFS